MSDDGPERDTVRDVTDAFGRSLEAITDRTPSRRAVLAALGAGVAGYGAGRFGFPGALSDESVVPPAISPATDQGRPHAPSLGTVPTDRATHVATGSGAWDDPATWDEGVPDDLARVHVPADVTVTVRDRETARLKWVRVDGALTFDPARDTELPVETLVTTPGSVLQIGTAKRPIRPEREARITVVDHGPIDERRDPTRVTKGVIGLGPVRIHGAKTTGWSALASAPRAGDRKVTLAETPTGWTTGDRLVIPGVSPHEDQDEEPVIDAVDGKTVTLDRPLSFDHVPPREAFDAYVANLDRNVVIASESEEVPRRGHVMFTGTDVDIRYLTCRDCGRTDKSYPFTNPIHGKPPENVPPNPRARYALHFHRTGIDREETPRMVVGAVVDGSPGWGVVNHHSYVEVTDSVTYDVLGAGFVAEAGNEQGFFRGNIAIRSEGSGEFPDSRTFDSDGKNRPGDVDDFGHGGHGFWLQGPGVAVEDNVAAGHRHHAYVFWNRALVDRELKDYEEIRNLSGTVPNYPLEYVDGMEYLARSDVEHEGKVPSSYVPLRSFSNNVAFASGGGLDLSRHQFRWRHRRFSEYSVLKDFTAFNVGPMYDKWGNERLPDFANAQGGNQGLAIRYSFNVRVDDATIVSGPDVERTKGSKAKKNPEGTTSVGINRNTPYPGNLIVESTDVEGFEHGARPVPNGVAFFDSSKFGNETDVHVRADRSSQRSIRFRDATVENGVSLAIPDGPDLFGLFAPDEAIKLDGRTVYLTAQAPDHVPVPSKRTIEKGHNADRVTKLTDADVSPEDLIGKTNLQLHEQYDLAVGGRLLPSGAKRHSGLKGGMVESPPSSPPREVWLSAEEASFEAPFTVVSNADAAGGKCLEVERGDSTGKPPDSGRARFEFSVAPGEYVLHARTHAPDGNSDSLWVRVDDGDWIQWNGLDGRRDWRWNTLHDEGGRRRFDLSGGKHRLQFAYREDGTMLDRVLLTADGTRPMGKGENAGGS